MRCQRLVWHPGGFEGYAERCKKEAKHLTALVKRGQPTVIERNLCTVHLKEVNTRAGMGWTTPIDWYTCKKGCCWTK